MKIKEKRFFIQKKEEEKEETEKERKKKGDERSVKVSSHYHKLNVRTVSVRVYVYVL